jgi:ribosome maturation factor RimP
MNAMCAKTTRKMNRDRIKERLAPIAESMGVVLLDALYTNERGRSILRLVIDKKGGITTDDCEKISEVADPLISDTLGIIDFDVFEVSSPGLDWPLKTMADCLRHEGEYAHVRLYQAVDQKKRFSGALTIDEEAGKVGVRDADGNTVLFPLKDIAHIRRDVHF